MFPDDPRLRNLTWFHKSWILANLNHDLEKRHGSNGESGSQEEYGLEDDEFKMFSKKARQIAEGQASGTS